HISSTPGARPPQGAIAGPPRAGTGRATYPRDSPAPRAHTGEVDRSKEIADFLRSRRAAISPDQAGLDADGRVRRVPGLRRDEVARLAGVSTEYYTRLEQGRAGNPSTEVLDALGGALRL